MVTGLVILSFLVAFLRGGRLRENLGLRHMWTAPVAYGLQVGAYALLSPGLASNVVVILSYLLLLYFGWSNLESQGVRMLLIGMVLNATVIFANGGYIPVDVVTASSIGVPQADALAHGPIAKHTAMTSTSKLKFLGDVIPVPSPPLPSPRIISIGDIFALIGMVVLIQEMMGVRVMFLRSEGSS